MKLPKLRLNAQVPEQRPVQVPQDNPLSLKALLADLIHRYGAAPALMDAERTLSYSELDELSRSIASFIIDKSHGEEPVVGVLCQRSSLVLTAALGAMRAGAAYLPVDPDMPLSRQETMLKPVQLILTDRNCLRLAEYFQSRNPAIVCLLCLDAPEYDEHVEKVTELSRASFWEHVAAPGSDEGWLSFLTAEKLPAERLEALAENVSRKCGLASKRRKQVLDIGCGSGMVARVLLQQAEHYTGIDLARNELARIENSTLSGQVTLHQFEAIDIGFLACSEYDLICLNGVVESFPGFNYLRRVLDLAVERLVEDGVLFVGAVWDVDRRDAFCARLRENALSSGCNKGLLRFEGGTELSLSRRFFEDYAAQSKVPLELTITSLSSECGELAEYRFDVVLRKGSVPYLRADKRRFGTSIFSKLPPNELPQCEPTRAAYIVYTSGSTGVPKAVVEEHRHLLHIIRALEEYSEGCGRISLLAPLTFDASIQQMALSVFAGKTLYILSEEERKSPEAFLHCVSRNALDLSDMTPAFFNVLVEHLASRRQALPLKRLLIAGEVLRPDMVRKFYSIPGNEPVLIYNVYGPTECTVDTTAFRLDYDNHRAFSAFPLGKPLAGTKVTVRDREGNALPESVAGEICISGAGVSRGYLNVDSSAVFVTLDGERAYRTGDLGFLEKDLVFYLGREDHQVKIRGNRVEIGEVEEAIARYPGVRQVVVVADKFQGQEEKSLAAYIVGGVDMSLLKGYLGQRLPSYSVPTYFMPMAELPLTANRKVDRKALPSPRELLVASSGRPLEGPLEEKLSAIWKNLLGVAVSDADANFFDLGGHSILAVRLVACIEKELGLSLSLSELFTHPTIGKLSALFANRSVSQQGPVIPLARLDGAPQLFLFHPIGGSVFCYSELAALLGAKLSVFAVEAAGFSPERSRLNTELHRVEDLAEYYLEEILKFSSGPIILGGWSFGGLVAYEAACRYEKVCRQRCGPVLILDSLASNSKAKAVIAKDDVDMLKDILDGLIPFDEDELRRLEEKDRLRYLVDCGAKCSLLPPGFSETQMENLLRTYHGNMVAAARYSSPTRSNKEIFLLRAMEISKSTKDHIRDPYLGWSSIVPEDKITLRWTEGSHETMLSPGLVKNVAQQILEHLEHA